MKIAVWHNLPSGGGKRALFDHVAGLLARGHVVESWCPPTADQGYLPLREICPEHVVPVDTERPRARTPLGRLFHPVAEIESRLDAMDRHCRECAGQMDAKGFDVLYASPCRFFRSSPIARHSRTPSVLYLQEPYRALFEADPTPPWAALPRSPGGRWSLRRIHGTAKDVAEKQAWRIQVREEVACAAQFDRLLVNSSFSREAVLRAYGLESRVCYLGVNTDVFRPTGEPREPFLVSLGGFDRNKAPDRAVRALATIAKERRPRLVWIANYTDAIQLETTKRLAAETGVELDVRVRIPDSDVISLLSRSTAMLYTARLEPFGLAPLEANACGTPVVAIAEGGVRETIRDGVNGLLAPDDDPAALGALVLRLLASREMADEMGRLARTHVETNWSDRRSVDNVEGHLERTAKGGRRSS